LVSVAEVNLPFLALAQITYRLILGFCNSNHQNLFETDTNGRKVELNLRLAKMLGGPQQHLGFVGRTNVTKTAIIANAHQQATSFGIGKGSQSPRNFAR